MTDAAPWTASATPPSPRLALARRLRARQPLYAVLDAARDRTIPDLLAASGCRHVNLFTGERAERLAAFAPYLVDLDPAARLLDDLLADWDANRGIFLASPVPPADLLAHLRELLWPATPDGPMLWRFYDPRVLRAALPTCDGRRAAAVFGPIQAFLCPGAAPERLLEAIRTETGVALRTIALSDLPLT